MKRDVMAEVQKITMRRIARIVPLASGQRAGDGADERRFEISFSSEEPYERWFGMEVLGHKQGEVDLRWLSSGSAPLLMQHDRADLVGVIEKAWIEDRRGKAIVRFGNGPRAQEIQQDVLDGIRGNVSVAYRVEKMVLEETGGDDGPDRYRVTSWKPVETSLVSIPADETVGVGRADEEKQQQTGADAPEVTRMDEKEKAAQAELEKARRDAEIEKARKGAVEADRKRRADIMALAAQHESRVKGARARAEELANGDGTQEDFRAWVLDQYGKGELLNLRQNTGDEGSLGLNQKERDRFSFVKAILSQVAGAGVDAGFEMECSRAVAKKIGKDPSGIFVPNDVLTGGRRDLQIAGGGTGGHVVSTDLLSANFIDVLRSKMILDALGTQFLTGLVGDIAIPKTSAGSTAYWVAEAAAVTESQATLAQVTGTPKTVGGLTDISRKLLKQGSIDVEAFVKNDIAQTLATAIETAAFNGSGAAGQPTGLISVSGVNAPTVTTDAPTWAQVVSFISLIMTDNADIGSMQWAMTAEVWGEFAATEKATNTGIFLLDPATRTMAGYPYQVSNNLPANHAIFGVWSQLILAMWGSLDLLVDPYTGSNAGTVRVVGMQDVDVLCRHGQAFSFDDAVTS